MPRHLTTDNGTELFPGDPVTTFRGDKAILVGWSAHRNRVYIRYEDENEKDGDSHELFPSVIDATLVDD